jgi:hypothetical protein
MDIILYHDEVVPGNVLNEHNSRAVVGCYWGWQQMGYPLLNDELMWNTLTAPRSDLVKRLPGGASELFRVCVEYFTTRQQDLTNGVVINLPGEASPRVVFGSVRIVVQDERAHKFGMSAMGASALKLCGLCANILSFKSDQLPCASGYFLPSTETDSDKFQLFEHADLLDIQAKLDHIAITGDSKALAEKQTQLGYNHNPFGLIGPGVKIDVASSWAFDWMHTYFVGGIYQKELALLLGRLASHDLGGRRFHEYLQLWQWPKAYASGKDICKHKQEGCSHWHR